MQNNNTFSEHTSQTKKLTVGLLWHSLSSDNLGVGALTESQIAICTSAAAKAGVTLSFIIFGTQGRLNYGPTNGSVKMGSRISIKQIVTGRSPFFKEIAECDLVLDIGEGDSFTDIYGISRYLFLIVSKIVVLAKLKPLILSPQTIGPFNNWFTRRIAASIMRRCHMVFARDGLSAKYLTECGVTKNVREAIDVAFRLPYQNINQGPTSTIRIGVNVSGLLYSGGYSGNNQFDLSVDYPTLIRSLLDRWTNDKNFEVWLFAHVVSDTFPRDDDRIAIKKLISEYPTAHLAPEFNSPSEAKSFISSMDFVTGARMHACIAAFSAGVPVAPFAYSRKFNGLFTSVDYSVIADGKSLNTHDAIELISDAFINRDSLKRNVCTGNKIAESKLADYEATLKSLFEKLTRTRTPAVIK
ncbi:MAG: hypothetical protein RIQ60_2293 [Pseudomonadota bacterium]|jgi:polysaccharide pyruvyl transferase WcaK-like protein